MSLVVDKPVPQRDRQLNAVGRFAVFAARHRRAVLAVWVLLLIGCAIAYPALNSRLQAPDLASDNSESSQAEQVVGRYFPNLGAEQSAIVFSSPKTTFDAATFHDTIEGALTAARTVPGVHVLVDPTEGFSAKLVSHDRHTAYAVVGVDGDMAGRAITSKQLQSELRSWSHGSVDVALTGYSALKNDLIDIERADGARAESIGIPVAFVLLILAFGAVAAAAIPIGIAVTGLLLCCAALLGLTTMMPVDAIVLSMATMIGTGVGIDYAMFVVSRFREELARSGDADLATTVGISFHRAGEMVLSSGLIVIVALCSLAVVPAPIFRGIALGVPIAVACALLVTLTLLPAVLATLGPRVNSGALPRLSSGVSRADEQGWWARRARSVMARPVLLGGAGIIVLVLAALPLHHIRYGIDLGVSALHGTTSGRAADTLAAEFQPGLLGPIQLVASGTGGSALDSGAEAAIEQLSDGISRDPRVAAVVPRTSQGRTVIGVIPAVSVDSPAGADLMRDIRIEAADSAARGGPEILVSGTTATFTELSHAITSRLVLVVALVLGLSLVFLTIIFRSALLPIKAILMNLLATGASLGLTVAVFQWGYGASWLGFQSRGFLQVFLPITVFVVLFGLSMDYEVFLIRRIKESWDNRTETSAAANQDAVVSGIARTARPITAAAAIMVVVFGSFVTADVLELKQIGFALAVAVAIDALVVRMVLVPAFMRLFGTWNWWLPGVRA